MDHRETTTELAEEIRRDGVEISGLLISDDGSKVRAMLPGLPERILAARDRQGEELMRRIKYLEAINERLTKEDMNRLAEHCLSCARTINGNAAAMSMALELICRTVETSLGCPQQPGCELEMYEFDLRRIKETATAALAAASRNCDTSKDDAEAEFAKEFGRAWNTAEDELATWLFSKRKDGE